LDDPPRFAAEYEDDEEEDDGSGCRGLLRRYGPGSLLVFLNASRHCTVDAFAERYRGGAPARDLFRLRKVVSQKLCAPYKALKVCVSGQPTNTATLLICEGQLLREALSSSVFSATFGFIEAWLCVASQLQTVESLEEVIRLLPDLYEMCVLQEEFHYPYTEEKIRRRKENKRRGRALYGQLCLAVVRARAVLPRGVYALEERDFSRDQLGDPALITAFLELQGGSRGGVLDLSELSLSERRSPVGEGILSA
jgi:hypothetical protein